MNYRFLLDNKGWRLFITTDKKKPKQKSVNLCAEVRRSNQIIKTGKVYEGKHL